MLQICQKLPLYSNIYLLQPESAIRGQAARSQIIARAINQPFKTTPNFHCLYKLIIYPPHEVSNSIVTSATSSKKSHYISIASITDKYSTLQLDEGKRETSTCPFHNFSNAINFLGNRFQIDFLITANYSFRESRNNSQSSDLLSNNF